MEMHVIGIIPNDDKFRTMEEIWNLCNENGIRLPTEVDDFFNLQAPCDDGVEICIDSATETYCSSNFDIEGFDIDISKLPPDVKIIRFYNCN